MKVFEDLGSLVENLWREKNYNDAVFPKIATRALAEAGLTERVTPWEIVRWVHTAPQLPTQQDVDGRFGNPPITLFHGPRFYIDIYFWVDGTTEIHQHAFAGAFQVLEGSSIHSRYSFRPEHAVNSRFLLGQVVFNDSELLRVGDVRPIIPGKEFIHALFHLDRPSATITIRTPDAPYAHPQYSYRKPHLAYDPFYKEPSMIKKLQTAGLLLTVDHHDCDAAIGDLLAASDFQTAFLLLQTAFHFLTSRELEKELHISTGKERYSRLLDAARRRHGSLVDLIPPVLEEDQRLADLVSRRGSITGKEHRFFLALLLNVPSRTKVLDLVKQYFPERGPIDTVLDWALELSTTKVWGSSEPNVLGIKDFDDDYLFVLQCLLEGLPREQMKAALKKEHPAKRARKLGENLEAIRASLANSTLFRTIVAG